MPVSSIPFERVSTDIMGPLPMCEQSKNQYVLVFICYLTKYVELVPLPDIKATTVATAFLTNVICRHGSPSYLHSDRGSNYLSSIVSETCKLLQVKKTQTSSYRPCCNGQSERMMRTIKDILSKYLDESKTWDRFIPLIQFAYNTAPSIDSTDYTPFFLVHGRHPKSPIDTILPNIDINRTAKEYITEVMEDIEIARKVAFENIQERKAEMLKKVNKNRENPQYNVGDIVYLYTPIITPGIGRKLNRKWVGPYYICQRISDIHVKLRKKSDGKLVKNRIHVDRLKPGYVWHDTPIDENPPQNENAIEPAVLADDEIPQNNFINDTTEIDNPDEINQEESDDNPDNDLFVVEKILRKKKQGNNWKYRVKWLGYDTSQNSWVRFDDLNAKCQEYVTQMHRKIPTAK